MPAYSTHSPSSRLTHFIQSTLYLIAVNLNNVIILESKPFSNSIVHRYIFVYSISHLSIVGISYWSSLSLWHFYQNEEKTQFILQRSSNFIHRTEYRMTDNISHLSLGRNVVRMERYVKNKKRFDTV